MQKVTQNARIFIMYLPCEVGRSVHFNAFYIGTEPSWVSHFVNSLHHSLVLQGFQFDFEMGKLNFHVAHALIAQYFILCNSDCFSMRWVSMYPGINFSGAFAFRFRFFSFSIIESSGLSSCILCEHCAKLSIFLTHEILLLRGCTPGLGLTCRLSVQLFLGTWLWPLHDKKISV